MTRTLSKVSFLIMVYGLWSSLGFASLPRKIKSLVGLPAPTQPPSQSRTTATTTTTTELPAHKVGFIGCGTIAAAIVTGLATKEGLVSSIAVSRRSKSKSDQLQQAFPDLVTVCDDNQEILDRSDIIFITVLPEQTSQVLQSLQFDSDRHDLVSLVVRTSLWGMSSNWHL